jgi:hypothetical protein
MNLFAFWSCAEFPYLLGGTVVRIGDSGNVETIEFGKGSWFTPVKILPLEAGKAAQAVLRKLQKEFASDMQQVSDEYQRRARKLYPDLCGKDKP